mmetsp:Transcript_148301/g.210622  ORF Transcript_148301/g.210622 Transcript_148301/m.210622 type:complete len:216 (+) Transcript_148301:28-675(+)
MSLIYALVARGNTILAEFTDSSGNFTTVTQNILDKIPDKDAKCTYVYDRFLFHYVRERGVVYLAMADEAFGRRVPYAFLAAIQKDFQPFLGRVDSAIAYAFNREFAPVIKRQMAYFSKSNSGGDKMSAIRAEMDEVKGVMVENIEKTLNRGEHIDLLVDKTENLSDSSMRFKKKSTKLKNSMWWANQRWCIGVTLLITAIIVIIIIVETEKNKKK